MTEIDSILILNAIPGLGNARIRKLIAHFGSARKVLAARQEEFSALGAIPVQVVTNIIEFPKDSFLKSEYNLMEKNHVEPVSWFDRDYPDSLREIPGAPVVLYRRGALRKIDSLAIAIVGSRQASVYGLTIAGKFAMGLAELGMSVVSGLARGIDTAAHQNALKANGKTVAVLGCGLAHIYPPENERLFDQIAESGAILSEFPMTTPPAAINFPRRNRIISGLSLGVIVVEASLNSGALITSDYALEQGREVFAVPGKVDSPMSQGVNNLIKQGAKLVTSLEDVLEELKPRLDGILDEKKEAVKPIAAIPVDLTEEEKEVYRHLSDDPVHIDLLVENAKAPISRVAAILFKLELKQAVKQLPGKLFLRRSINN